jgi:AMMECR1 domain-containing protein
MLREMISKAFPNRTYKFQAIIFEEEKPRGKVRLKALGGK